MRPLYWLLMVVAALGWGWGGVGTRAGFLEGIGPWTMVTFRIAIAAVLLAVVLVVRRSAVPTAHDLRMGAVQAMFNLGIPYVLFTFAYDQASAGFVGLIAAMIPLATSLFANFMLPDEPLTIRKLVALFVALTGVAALLLSGDSGLSEGGRPMVAVGLGLAAVASVGYASVYAKDHAGTYEPLTLSGLQFAFASPFLLVVTFVAEGVPTDVTPKGWLIVLSLAIFATAMPFLIFYWLLRHISATDASLIGYLVPLVALSGGIAILGEQLQPGLIIGGALIVVGIILSDRETRRAARLAFVASEA